jgi:uncharacterized protein
VAFLYNLSKEDAALLKSGIWLIGDAMHIILLFISFAILVLSGCSPPENSVRETTSGNSIPGDRAKKDAAFKSDPESPIPPQDRSRFRGLEYYPVDMSLRFSVRLMRHKSPAQVRLSSNTGEIRSGIRYGYFDFQVQGKMCRLQVYRLDDAPAGEAQLFIPFRDTTTGAETYAAGRYLDLKENTSGIYDLDFNRAYNPSCAYDNKYSCPVPPAENTLPVAIRAGEKKYLH